MEEQRAEPAFGVLLRRLRIAAGLTQELLAERARISVQAVSSLERGARHAPRADTLELLVETLGLRGDARAAFEASARSSQKTKVRREPTLLRAVQPADRIPGVPVFSTTFVGRSSDVEAVVAGLATGSCLTLWGTGGVGKTRLAAESVALVRHTFDRVLFVPLATALDGPTALDAIAGAAHILPSADEDLAAQLASAFGGGRTLLVLDNCEHVVSSIAAFARAVLLETSDVAILCTSREPLRIDPERLLPVEPLAAPDALRLFVDRAAAVVGPQTPTPGELDRIEAICRRLDGIPLALELAAACVRGLDLERIAGGLDERFRLLTRGHRTDERHGTLRATIAWSYGLLPPWERLVLERVASINGAFSIEDAFAIVVDPGADTAETMHAIASLVDKSLVAVERAGFSGFRYRLLESTRAFVADLGADEHADPDPDEAERRFGRYLLENVGAASRQSLSSGDNTKLRAISLDHLRGYLRWSIERRHDPERGAALAARFNYGWTLYGLDLEGIRWIEKGLEAAPAGPPEAALRADVLIGLARAYTSVYDHRSALARSREVYEYARAAGDAASRAIAANLIAVCYVRLREPGAVEFAQEAWATFDELGDVAGAATAFSSYAMATYLTQRDEHAIEVLREAVRRRERIGNRRHVASAKMDLAEGEFGLGHVDRAIEAIEWSIAEYRRSGSQGQIALALINLASYALADGALETSRAAALEALEIGRSSGDARVITLSVQLCAALAALEGRELEAAALLYGYVSEASGGAPFTRDLEYTEYGVHERLRTELGKRMTPEAFAETSERGSALVPETAIDLGFLCGRKAAGRAP